MSRIALFAAASFAALAAVVSPTIAQPLLINEIDYDQPGASDTMEFIEIKNVSAAPVSLANLALVLINGANGAEYQRVQLAPAVQLDPGKYLVVGNGDLQMPLGTPRLSFATPTNVIQNGAPDGVALIDTTTLTVMDTLSYEGAITAANIVGFPAPISLVQGTPTPAIDSGMDVKSLVRFPDGFHTANDVKDWRVSPDGPTPGSPNSACFLNGDLDGDRTVGLSDIAPIINCWGQSVDCYSLADLDLNGEIGLGDLAIVIQNWGQSCPF